MLPVTQAPICGSILPHTTEFEELDTGIGDPGSLVVVAGGAAYAGYMETQTKLDKFIPNTIGEVCHYGWNQAFVYTPASTHAAGTSANCELMITMHYHVNLQVQNASITNGWGVPTQSWTPNLGVSDARMASAIQTTVDGLKQARIANPQTAFASVTQPDTLASHAPRILQSIAKAAPDVAQTIADLLPAGSLPQRIASGIATVGHTLFG